MGHIKEYADAIDDMLLAIGKCIGSLDASASIDFVGCAKHIMLPLKYAEL